MPYIEKGDSSLYYEDHGQGAPVVLLHGVGGNHASWFYQIAAWSSNYRLIVVDARGFGKSTDAEGYGSSAFTDDLTHLLNHLALDQVILVAQSMGGGAAVDFTVREPRRVRGLVIADSLVWLSPPEALKEQLAENVKKNAGLTQPERVLGPTFRKAHPAFVELYLQIAGFNKYALRTLPGTQQKHSPQVLAATGVPTLFVVGEEDVLFPAHIVKQVAGLVSEAQFIALPNAGHSAYFEQPDEFCRQVGTWMQALA